MPVEQGYLLPEIINPAGVRCIVVKLPDDPAYERAFWGQMHELTRWHAWDRDEAKTGRDVAAVMWQYVTWAENCREARTVLGCEFCCTETNELLQQILDALGANEGDTSIINSVVNVILQNQNNQVYNIYIADWQAVHEDIPDTTYTEDTDDETGDVTRHEAVLCATIDQYIDTILEVHRAALGLAREIVYAVAAGAIAAQAYIPGLMILLGAVIWENIDDEVFGDLDARQLLRCCMYASLKDASPGDWETFHDSVEDCGFEPFSNEGMIAGMVHSANWTRVNHALFLLTLGGLWAGAELDLIHGLDRCQCGETPADCWDFEDGDRQGWLDAEGTVFEMFEEPDTGEIFTTIPGSVNGYTLGSWGEGSNLSCYVELPTLTDVNHFAFRIWIAAPGIGKSYWLRFFDEDHILIWQRTGAFSGATGWYSLDENTPALSDVAYIAFSLDSQWQHALDVIRINAGGLGAC